MIQVVKVGHARHLSDSKADVLLQSLISGSRRPECREKLSVQDRSSAHQPITGNNLLWTLRRILRGSCAAESTRRVSDSRPWFRTTPQRLVSAADVWQRYKSWNKDHLQLRILGLRGEVHWIQAERAQHVFCRRDGRVNASLGTGTQVDRRNQCLAVLGLYVPPQNKRCTLRQRKEVRGPDVSVQQDLNLDV